MVQTLLGSVARKQTNAARLLSVVHATEFRAPHDARHPSALDLSLRLLVVVVVVGERENKPSLRSAQRIGHVRAMSDGCVSKAASASASGLAFGTLIGALNATWQVRLARNPRRDHPDPIVVLGAPPTPRPPTPTNPPLSFSPH